MRRRDTGGQNTFRRAIDLMFDCVWAVECFNFCEIDAEP